MQNYIRQNLERARDMANYMIWALEAYDDAQRFEPDVLANAVPNDLIQPEF